MAAVGIAKDQVERVHQVVLINLAALFVHVEFPAIIIGKLAAAVAEHLVRQAREIKEIVTINEVEHYYSLHQFRWRRLVAPRS